MMNVGVQALLWAVYLISLYFAVFWFLVFLDGMPNDRKVRLKRKPRVAVVVPAYNEEKRIIPTLKELVKLNYPKELLELIVVDDGSKDRTASLVKEFMKDHKDIRLIQQKNKGKGAAMNAALYQTNADFFVCLDADSFVEPDALNKILPYFSSKDVGAVLPILKVKKPKNLLQKMQWFEYIINMFYKVLMSKLDCVHVTPGPFAVYRRDLLVKLGGFDENHNLTEDLEIALRIQKHNYRIIQLLKPEVLTIAPKTFKELYKQRNRWYKGSIINAIKYRKLMFNKNYGDFGLIQMPTVIISGILALVMISTIAYYTIKPYVSYAYNLWFIGFDISTILRNLSFNFYILDLDFTTILIAITMIAMTIIIIRKSHQYTQEKVMRYGIMSLIMYLFAYFFILGIVWVGITFDFLRGKRQKW